MAAVAQKPDFAPDAARAWLRENFGVDGVVEALPGERDLNLKVRSACGDMFVCKISADLDERGLLGAQHEVLALLNERDVAAIPRVLVSVHGESLLSVDIGGQPCLGRVLTYVPGRVLAECTPCREPLLRDIGRTIGQLDQALDGYDHSAFRYRFDWDLAHGGEVVERYRDLIEDPEMRGWVDQVHGDFCELAVPRFGQLRMGVIHNDANDYNVLAKGDRVTGLIDFGDMVYSHTVSDLAIAVAYATLQGGDARSVIREVALGYHEARPLEEVELAVLFPMMRMRLAVSACMAAHQMRLRPEDAYLAVSQEPIRRTLPKLLALKAGEVHELLKESLS